MSKDQKIKLLGIAHKHKDEDETKLRQKIGRIIKSMGIASDNAQIAHATDKIFKERNGIAAQGSFRHLEYERFKKLLSKLIKANPTISMKDITNRAKDIGIDLSTLAKNKKIKSKLHRMSSVRRKQAKQRQKLDLTSLGQIIGDMNQENPDFEWEELKHRARDQGIDLDLLSKDKKVRHKLNVIKNKRSERSGKREQNRESRQDKFELPADENDDSHYVDLGLDTNDEPDDMPLGIDVTDDPTYNLDTEKRRNDAGRSMRRRSVRRRRTPRKRAAEWQALTPASRRRARKRIAQYEKTENTRSRKKTGRRLNRQPSTRRSRTRRPEMGQGADWSTGGGKLQRFTFDIKTQDGAIKKLVVNASSEDQAKQIAASSQEKIEARFGPGSAVTSETPISLGDAPSSPQEIGKLIDGIGALADNLGTKIKQIEREVSSPRRQRGPGLAQRAGSAAGKIAGAPKAGARGIGSALGAGRDYFKGLGSEFMKGWRGDQAAQ